MAEQNKTVSSNNTNGLRELMAWAKSGITPGPDLCRAERPGSNPDSTSYFYLNSLLFTVYGNQIVLFIVEVISILLQQNKINTQKRLGI